MSLKNILITGVNGLVGEELSARLQKKGYNVTGIGRSDKKHTNTILLDLNSDWDINQLPGNVDVIVHLAQSEKFRDFPGSAVEVYNVNTNSTLKLLDYARKTGVKKFIYASSGGVYGTGNTPFSETSPVNTESNLGFYMSTKLISEILVKNYQSFFETCTLRFFFVYGPKQRKDMLIPRLVESVKNGTPIKLQGEEGIKINPVFVEDAANAIEKLFSVNGNNIYNIGGDEILSLKEIALQIGKQFNKTPVFEIDRNSVPGHVIGNTDLLNKTIGQAAKSSFISALKHFA
ncbi:MAG: NAD-dependent epimerase/dehydratase family protein [Bacteroidia bacterium]